MTSIYVTIGNSDDRLTQAEWADYRASTDIVIREAVEWTGGTVHGAWVSPSAEPFQNACWCFTLADPTPAVLLGLRVRLRLTAEKFRQESIAWAEAEVEFLSGAPS